MNKRPRRVRPPVVITLPSSAVVSEGVLTVSDRQLTDLFNTVKPLQVRKELRKHKSRSDRLEDALLLCQDAKAEVDSLFEEIESWADGMEGTNLEYSFKYGQLEECKQYLEEIQDILSGLESYEGGVVEFPSMF
tara:strand:+ start:100 stop:501 length:402 start_codon:yes stop_codon:yes gene_type:complete